MSGLNPEGTPKRMSVDPSEFMGSRPSNRDAALR